MMYSIKVFFIFSSNVIVSSILIARGSGYIVSQSILAI
jgi:hypothetical protein